jgi:hypothetical protein
LDVFYPLMVVASLRCLTRLVFLLSKLNFSSLCRGSAPLGLGTAPWKDRQVGFYLTCADIQSRFLNRIFPSWKDSLPGAQCMPKFEPIHRCPTLRNAALRYVLSTPLSLTLVGCSRGPSDSRLQRDGRPQQDWSRMCHCLLSHPLALLSCVACAQSLHCWIMALVCSPLSFISPLWSRVFLSCDIKDCPSVHMPQSNKHT